VVGLAKVLCAYHGVPAPQNGCPALLLRVDDVVDILCSDDDFWWEVSISTVYYTVNDSSTTYARFYELAN